MANGTVKWFNSRKGYGFITLEGDAESDIFVHYSAIVAEDDGFKSLREGDEVEFQIIDGQKGQEAREVTVTKKAPRQQRSERDPQD
jgi:cold shock protein